MVQMSCTLYQYHQLVSAGKLWKCTHWFICNIANLNIIITDSLTKRMTYWLNSTVWLAQLYTSSQEMDKLEKIMGYNNWELIAGPQLLNARRHQMYTIIFSTLLFTVVHLLGCDFPDRQMPNAMLFINQFSSHRCHNSNTSLCPSCLHFLHA